MDNGWIKLHRKVLLSDIMLKPPLYFKLWVWMLFQARFNPSKKLKRGQFKTSIQEMREAMSHKIGYKKITPTIKQIRGVYTSLALGTMIAHAKVTGGVLITICNYDKYQTKGKSEGHNEGHNEGTLEGTPYIEEEGKKKEEERNKYSVNLKKFTEDFIEYIKINEPSKLPTNKNLLSSSLDTMEKLTRLDGFKEEYIFKIIRWAKKDDFWQDQVYSLSALRLKGKSGLTKFQNIIISYDKKQKPNQQNSRSANNAEACNDFINEMLEESNGKQ